jgi:hypothetical protein
VAADLRWRLASPRGDGAASWAALLTTSCMRSYPVWISRSVIPRPDSVIVLITSDVPATRGAARPRERSQTRPTASIVARSLVSADFSSSSDSVAALSTTPARRAGAALSSSRADPVTPATMSSSIPTCSDVIDTPALVPSPSLHEAGGVTEHVATSVELEPRRPRPSHGGGIYVLSVSAAALTAGSQGYRHCGALPLIASRAFAPTMRDPL